MRFSLTKKSMRAKKITNLDLAKAYGWSSRKYRTAWYLTILFSALLVIPAVATLVLNLLHIGYSIQLMPIGVYETLMGLIWTVYFGANIIQKHKVFSKKASIPKQILDEVEEGLGLSSDSGGQPLNTDNP